MIEKTQGRSKAAVCETFIVGADGNSRIFGIDSPDPLALAKVLSKRHKRANATSAVDVKARLMADMKRRRV